MLHLAVFLQTFMCPDSLYEIATPICMAFPQKYENKRNEVGILPPVELTVQPNLEFFQVAH